MKKSRIFEGLFLSFAFLSFFISAILGIQQILSIEDKSSFSASVSGVLENIPERSASVSKIPELNVKSALSLETDLQGQNRIIFEKDANMQLPIASITKLMTAVIALDNQTSQTTLLQMMIVGSDNKAAEALAKEKDNFIELMNQKAESIGLKNTFFVDPTGLNAQNISTAKDLAIFAEYILKNYPKIAEISKIKELYVPDVGIIKNTDQLLQEISDVACSKTGFTNNAKGCLLLAVKNPQNNNYSINIILGADDRFSEMKKIINHFYSTCK